MNFKLKIHIVLTVCLLFLSHITLATEAEKNTQTNTLKSYQVAESAGCRSCVKEHDCSKIDRTCNGTCKARLFTSEDDLLSCRAGCSKDLERCLANAKQACGFYCS